MLKKIAEQIVNWQIQKVYLEKEEQEIYIYAYEVLLNQLINILISVLVAICMKDALSVVVFLCSYIPLRSYCGGYHAKTNLRCSAISAILLFAVCIIVRAIPDSVDLALALMAFLVSGVLIFRYAPVESRNKPLDETEHACYRKRGRIVWLFEIVVAAFACLLSWQITRVIALSHVVFCILLYAEVLKIQYLKQKDDVD